MIPAGRYPLAPGWALEVVPPATHGDVTHTLLFLHTPFGPIQCTIGADRATLQGLVYHLHQKYAAQIFHFCIEQQNPLLTALAARFQR